MKTMINKFSVALIMSLIMVSCSNDDDKISNSSDVKSKDTEAPKIFAFYVKSNTETSATLSWSEATDNVGVIVYEIKQDNKVIATLDSSKKEYVVNNLKTNIDYVFTIAARDKSGNISKETKTTLRIKSSPIPEKSFFKIDGEVKSNKGFSTLAEYSENLKEVILRSTKAVTPFEELGIYIPKDKLKSNSTLNKEDVNVSFNYNGFSYSNSNLIEGTETLIMISDYDEENKHIGVSFKLVLKQNPETYTDGKKSITVEGEFSLNIIKR